MGDLKKYIDLIRKNRHDFMNDVQIIYGYLQVNKLDKACEYIDELSNRNQIISEIYSLEDNIFGFCMENNLKDLWNKDVKVDVDIEIDFFYRKVFEKEYNKKCDLVNNIFNKFKNSSSKIYIYIFEDDLGQNLLVCNDDMMIDEVNWMDNWEKIKVNIDDINLYNYYDNDSKAYRIVFI